MHKVLRRHNWMQCIVLMRWQISVRLYVCNAAAAAAVAGVSIRM